MEIDKSFDNLIDTVKNTPVYQEYKHALEQVKNNTDINDAVKNIKNIQKKIVNENYRGNDTKQLEIELESTKSYLNSIPLYKDYIEYSDTLNELIKNITDKLQTYLNGLDI